MCCYKGRVKQFPNLSERVMSPEFQRFSRSRMSAARRRGAFGSGPQLDGILTTFYFKNEEYFSRRAWRERRLVGSLRYIFHVYNCLSKASSDPIT